MFDAAPAAWCGVDDAMLRSSPALPAFVFVALVAPATSAEEPYRVLFDQGLADMQAGRYESGCRALAESYRLDPRPGTLFTLAECEAKRGKIASAVARYSDYLALHDKLPPDKRAKQLDRDKIAQKQRAALAPLIPELTLRLPEGAPPGVVVKQDDLVVEPSALDKPMALDPGEHVIVTRAPDGSETTLRVTLVAGEHRTVTLEVKRAPGAAEVPARRYVAYASGGIGVAGVGVGAVAGILMFTRKGTIEDNCRDSGPKVKVCNAAGAAAGESAKTLGAVSTVGLSVGVAALGVGLALLLTEPKAPSAPASAVVTGLRALMIGAGPEGAMIGARGRW